MSLADRILALLAADVPPVDVAAEVGVTKQRVYQVRSRAGLAPRGRRRMPSEYRSERAEQARPFADRVGVNTRAVELDGGRLTIEPSDDGAVLLSLHEFDLHTSVARADAAAREAIIAALVVMRGAK